MDTTELFTKLTKDSGRADLTDSEWLNYLNAAIKFLDDRLGISVSNASPKLSEFVLNNWWSRDYPELLVRATLYQLELDYRNTEGAKDWLTSIDTDLRQIDYNIVEEQYEGINQMEG
jgi:hypothetical protein